MVWPPFWNTLLLSIISYLSACFLIEISCLSTISWRIILAVSEILDQFCTRGVCVTRQGIIFSRPNLRVSKMSLRHLPGQKPWISRICLTRMLVPHCIKWDRLNQKITHNTQKTIPLRWQKNVKSCPPRVSMFALTSVGVWPWPRQHVGSPGLCRYLCCKQLFVWRCTCCGAPDCKWYQIQSVL